MRRHDGDRMHGDRLTFITLPMHWLMGILRRAMLHNPKDYPKPELFNPERFLRNGSLDPTILNPMDVAFGFGRRYIQSPQQYA